MFMLVSSGSGSGQQFLDECQTLCGTPNQY